MSWGDKNAYLRVWFVLEKTIITHLCGVGGILHQILWLFTFVHQKSFKTGFSTQQQFQFVSAGIEFTMIIV